MSGAAQEVFDLNRWLADRRQHAREELWRVRTFAAIAESFEAKFASGFDLEGLFLAIETSRGDILITLDDELFIEVTDSGGHTIHSEVIETEKDLKGGVEALRDRLLAMLDGLEEAA